MRLRAAIPEELLRGSLAGSLGRSRGLSAESFRDTAKHVALRVNSVIYGTAKVPHVLRKGAVNKQARANRLGINSQQLKRGGGKKKTATDQAVGGLDKPGLFLS